MINYLPGVGVITQVTWLKVAKSHNQLEIMWMQPTKKEAKIERMDQTMKRKFLEDLGIEKDLIDKILDENSSDIGKAKGEAESIQAERDTLKKTVADRDKQLEDLKKSTGDVEGMKKQITDLQEANKTKDAEHASNIKKLKYDTALEKALEAAKAKNAKAVKALLDLDPEKAEFNDDGSIKGLDKTLKGLQEAEESGFLFHAADGKPPTFKGMKPGEGSGGSPAALTKDQFTKMSYKERNELFNTDKTTYDALVGTK